MIVILDKTRYRGKPQDAKTLWKLVKIYNKYSIIKVIIQKGVRHQIRVHLSYLGLPIIGDKLYNENQYKNINNHLLYASGVKFISMEGKNIELSINVPFINDKFLKSIN